MMRTNLCILSNRTKFSDCRPHFQRAVFRPQWLLPLALIVWGCGLTKIINDWKYAQKLNWAMRCGRLTCNPTNDYNCHPSSIIFCILSERFGHGAAIPKLSWTLLTGLSFQKRLLTLLLWLLCCRRTEVNVTTGVTTHKFPMVTFTLQLRRKSLYYVINHIVPCGLLSFIAVATFLLQPGCGERVGLGK